MKNLCTNQKIDRYLSCVVIASEAKQSRKLKHSGSRRHFVPRDDITEWIASSQAPRNDRVDLL